MSFLAMVASVLLLANTPAQDGAPRIKLKVKGVESARDRGSLERSLRALASIDDVLAGKDGTVTILMKQDKKPLTLRLSDISAAVEKAGGEMALDIGKSTLDGKFQVETDTGGLVKSINGLKGVRSVGKPLKIKQGTVSFEVTAKGLRLSALMGSAANAKIGVAQGPTIQGEPKIDLVWTSPAKKKAGGGG
jgi:hypothetical protein